VSVRARGAALAVAVAAACNPLGDGGGTGSSVSSPLNACPAHPCGNYVQSGVTPSCECPGTTCTVGECLVSSTYTGLVVVVSLSADSFYAPGQTFAIPEEDLFKPKATDSCAPPMCAHLPALGIVQGAYLVDPATQVTLGWNLGNAGHNTALPIHVTYRPLWQPGGSGTAAVDATSIGLPLPVVDGYVVVESGVGSQPGPGGGLSIGFQANVQPGLYETTFQPDPPFDGAFPPDVKPATIAAGNTIDDDALVYDVTTKVTGGVTGPIVPTFSLTRSGGLVGWTAYLRDQTTKRRVSTLAALGTKTSAVQLATNHEPPSVDALTNAELAVVPPAGSMVPTFVVGLVGGELPSLEPLPDLPDLTTVTGVVTDADGVTPVEADLVFEVHAGASTANGIEVLGPPAVLNPTNFDYTARASATLSPDGSTASYSVDLPPGQYQLTLRPRDGAHAVTVQSAFPVPIADTAIESDLLAGATQAVTGRALLGDGRLLSGALVQVLPTACSLGTGDDCLPRPASTMTGDDGSWALALDPGTYALQLQPAPGSRFPWVTQALLIGPTPVTVPPVVVPVPVSSTLAFHDPYDNPSVSALVRVFQVPPTGPAVEMARAITDATGQAELYLAPSKP
jgi:hypothetical protein